MPRLLSLAGWVTGALVLATFANAPVRGQNVFERLVMPGPLIEGHAKLEKDCNQCHRAFDQKAQTQLCLDCHKDVARDRADRTGFHGRRAEALGKDCRQCHSDHKGRSFDAVALDRETFDHDDTDFVLKGRHGSAPCAGCHKAGTKLRAAPGACVDCHKAADAHKGRLGEKCQACHEETAWARTKPFDHSKTRFPLTGAHKDVGCRVCHAGELYKDLATTCVSCHKLQDRHAGSFGDKCETCHKPLAKPAGWKQVHFDHDRQTRFPRRGAHAKAACEACHTAPLLVQRPSRACVSCHRADDAHKGQLGERCERCHSESGWRQKVAFDHDTTRFPLIARHAVVTCEACHRSAAFKDVQRDCSGCHKDTHHQGRLGTQCARCHNPNGWAFWRFDHDRSTRFALTGAHSGLQCHACHSKPMAAKVVQSSTCYGCHARDDAHQGQFGQACGSCHTTEGFRVRALRR